MMLSEGVLHGEIPMAVLPKDKRPEDLRRLLIEEAEEYRRKHPVPPMEEVLAEIRPWRLPEGAPDSTTLLRHMRDSLDELPLSFCSDSEVKRRLIEVAEEYLRRSPNPQLREALEEIRQDSTMLMGEDRER
jgi:hypothetical protein